MANIKISKEEYDKLMNKSVRLETLVDNIIKFAKNDDISWESFGEAVSDMAESEKVKLKNNG